MKPIPLRGVLSLCVLWAAVAAAPAARAERVEFATEDGFTLVGDLRAGKPDAPAIILLHMYKSDRKAWAPLVPKLRAAGYTVLAIDQRAHGESVVRGESTLRVEELPRGSFGDFVRAGPSDVAAARLLLAKRGLGKGKLALVGASYGCSVALLSSTSQDGIHALVLLSPGTAYFGVEVTEPAAAFPGPIFGVAAEDDPGSARATRSLLEAHAEAQAASPAEGGAPKDDLLIFPTGGHGTRLFGPRPEVAKRIVDFLGGALAP